MAHKNTIMFLLSFFYPIKKKVKTEMNGILELVYCNGVKLLNSANANYSYGSLERVLNFGLKKTNLNTVSSVLLLGLGGACVVKSLRKRFKFYNKITAVEIDKSIIDLALNEYKMRNDENLHIVCSDAENFIEHCPIHFDLIIVDLFIDNKVSCSAYESFFWKKVINTNSKNGKFVFNASMNNLHEDELNNLIGLLKQFYKIKRYDNIEKTNTLILGEKLPYHCAF